MVTENRFSTTLDTSINHVPDLVENEWFSDVFLKTGSLAAGQTVTLPPLGTVTTLNMRYRMRNFTVQDGATLNVGAGTRLQLEEDQVLTIAGAVNIADAESIVMVDDTNGASPSVLSSPVAAI